MRLNTFVVSILFFVLSTSSASAIGIGQISQLIVFGDSLVDAGNTQNALGGPGITPCAFTGGIPPCDPAPSAFGYFDGRFTNGPTGADVLNQAISGGNSVASSEGGSNYSYGGARASGGTLPDLSVQVLDYQAALGGGSADADALYLINIGGNDVRDQVFAVSAGTNTQTDQEVITSVVTAITAQIIQLQALGAQYILVAGVGNVGGIPETAGLGAAAQLYGRTLSVDLNSQLVAALDPSVATLDVIGLFDAVNANPTSFGLPALIDNTGACLFDGTPPNCSLYAFFDSVHPTTALSGILGDAMILAVPEPGTALLFGLGLWVLASRRETLKA